MECANELLGMVLCHFFCLCQPRLVTRWRAGGRRGWRATPPQTPHRDRTGIRSEWWESPPGTAAGIGGKGGRQGEGMTACGVEAGRPPGAGHRSAAQPHLARDAAHELGQRVLGACSQGMQGSRGVSIGVQQLRGALCPPVAPRRRLHQAMPSPRHAARTACAPDSAEAERPCEARAE